MNCGKYKNRKQTYKRVILQCNSTLQQICNTVSLPLPTYHDCVGYLELEHFPSLPIIGSKDTGKDDSYYGR